MLPVAFIIAAPASAYQVRKSTTGAPLRWAEGVVSLTPVFDGGPVGVRADDAAAALGRAADVYRTALGELVPEISVELRSDGHNTVRWVTSDWNDDYDPAALAVTVTSYDRDSGRITGADVAVNADTYAWSAASDESRCRGAYDLQDVLTHEVGHVFGLGHEMFDVNATMYPSANMCESQKRDLDDDDLAGLSYLYVQVGPASEGCSVGGRPQGGALLVAALLLLARLRRRTVALLLLMAAPAGATILVKLPLEKVGSGAAVVVQGTVRSVEPIRRNGRIYTDAVVTVDACLRGSCAAAVTVRQLGGEIDGAGVAVEGAARFAVGDEVMLFLRPRLDGAFAPVGMAQGAFQVERGADGAVRAFRRDLRGASFAGDAPGGLERLSPAEVARAVSSGRAP